MTYEFPLSDEAKSFIESAEILAEPWRERVDRLTRERDEARAEVARLRDVIGNEAWFGSWECGCTDTEPRATSIPEFCPRHGVKLICDHAGRTKVQLTHSGVSGYGFRAVS